ncbi:helicase-related protein [Virgibacillus halophilus]|uniref:ATP-dependent DNA helicase RecQ n=2 Tax=Tigheibacillus halophilus TaxID=361280 RepID=A0ABU5CBB5_9BACI|nr:helicase-related protein [Virgibacillus halophilus]
MTEKVENENEKLESILSLIARCSGPVLVYFSSRQMAEKIASHISRRSQKRVAAYHGGLEQLDRLLIQQQFMLGQLDVVCCTSAFGMGIDKSDIRMVIHYHMPPDIKSYIQEAGRAGRDGKKSLCVLFYAEHDEFLLQQLVDMEIPSEELITQAVQVFKNVDKYLPDFQEESFIRLLGLTESQWHFLQNQFEKHDMMIGHHHLFNEKQWKIIEAGMQSQASSRRTQKKKRVYEMLAFIHTDKCLRAALYRHFQSDFTQTPICCNNCGFSFSDLDFPVKQSARELEAPWKQKLRDLMLINDTDE